MKTITTTASTFEMDQEFNDERFCRVRIAVMHSGLNRNNSYFSKETIEKAKDSFANIPILADVQELTDDDGNTYLDYTAHSMHQEKDAFDDESTRTIYDEKVVGVIPEQNDFELVHDDERNVDMVYVTGLLYRSYGNYVCDILEKRNGQTEVSAEIICNEMEYNARGNFLEVTDMTMGGVTLLGEHVMPGMEGANAQTFSKDENDINTQMLVFMQEIKESLDKYINLAKGGNTMFEKLLEKYGKTVEDIEFDYEGLSDEELETAFANAFTDAEEEEKPEEETEDETPEEDEKPEEEFSDEEELPEEEPEEETDKSGFPLAPLEIHDKIRALYELVYATYDEWFDVSIYDDYIIMHGWGENTGYKQSYTENEGVFELVGERVPVVLQWLTSEEAKAVEELKANYSALEQKVAQYEAEPQKMEILQSEEYACLSEIDEFKELMSNHFDYSVDEVRAKVDEILLNYAKTTQTFSKSVGSKTLPSLRKKGRYGNLFN